MRRRSVLLSAASSAVTGAALLGHASRAPAHQETSPLADHPLTGTWLAMANQTPGAPQVPAPSHFGADGSVLLVFPLTHVGMQGVEFSSPYLGTWEAESDRRGHFTATQLLSDRSGAFLGSVTVDGYPEVSEDGQRFIDHGARVTLTIRDAAGVVVEQLSGVGAPPVTGIRMAPGAPGFPDGLPAGTPMPGTPLAGTPLAGTPIPFATPEPAAVSPPILPAGRRRRIRAGRRRRRRRTR
jgi:hypothetical protein